MIRLLPGFWKLYKKNDNAQKIITGKGKEFQAPLPLFRPKKEKIHIQVGLDFGTSSTKIVYTQPGKRFSRIIDFKHNLPNYPTFCLPSVANINKQGKLVLGVDAAEQLFEDKWDAGFQRLKVLVAGNNDHCYEDQLTEEAFYQSTRKHRLDASFTPERLMAIFLAHSMYLAWRAISNETEYGHAELDIAFNICMPIDHIENNRVKTEFEKIFRWAEPIYRMWKIKEETFDPLQASYEFENHSIPDRDVRVFAVPEAVAEVAAYLVSLKKKEGLHAVIDLGAGTTDLSIFHLQIPVSGAISYWYAARNLPRGTIVDGHGIMYQ